MVRKFSSIAFAGALLLAAVPASAQDLGGAINGLTQAPGQLIGGMGQGLGIDLDPFHILTPAPQPVVAPPEEPMMQHRRGHRMMRHSMMHHHTMMRHNGMMYHHKKMMMHEKKMMKQKKMMKSEKMMMKKDEMKK